MASKAPAIIATPIAEEVLEGLSARPKRLPAKLFYDEQGSRLFDEITRTPEYYPTRTERAILQAHAGEIVRQAGNNLVLIELGAGNASKTSILVEALSHRQLRVEFHPVDVSPAALREAVASMNGRFPNLAMQPIVADYSEHLPELKSLPGRKLVLFIGSTIGNFEPDEAVQFLQQLRQSLNPGDALLLGLDLIKGADVLHEAYNDAQGVTAAFNKNVLARINRELGGHFDLEAFEHRAFWNSNRSRIEMHLESNGEQRVWVRDLERVFHFAAGERIHTENSYKFSSQTISGLVHESGFRMERCWADPEQWFRVVLARV
ncbi:MAG TPA: L-histidine N(alpha)-methyltransferase [Verrucomicrobiae bacterium]|jgi:L-histidine N-alpha-methyltransferase|nr:L-histidine N(alpha)-methyltransferase [Verrucomicrobiae bacterium]